MQHSESFIVSNGEYSRLRYNVFRYSYSMIYSPWLRQDLFIVNQLCNALVCVCALYSKIVTAKLSLLKFCVFLLRL